MDKKPVVLEGTVQNYPWGSVGPDSLVARLVGKSSDLKPYAELWFGAHPRGAARVKLTAGATTLEKLIATAPEQYLGAGVSARFSGQLPFLFKVLSVNQALSIQAHPDRERAAKLHQRLPAEYPDTNHKPEIAIPLSEMKLLYGFRPDAEIQEELKLTPELAAVAGTTPATARALHAAILHADPALREQQCRLLQHRLGEKRSTRPVEDLILNLVLQYGYRDAGIFTAFLMNLCTVSPGCAVFVGANIPHAYLSGDLIECMANSDNVVRAGLTTKFQDAETLLAMLSYDCNRLAAVAASEQGESVRVRRYQTPTEEFQVEELSGRGEVSESTGGKPVLLMALEGGAELESGGGVVKIETGRAALVPACADTYRLLLHESTRLFRVTVPD